MTVPDIDHTAFVRDWEEWHQRRDQELAAPHGFLAVTGLRWLGPEPTRFDDAPGVWSHTEDGVVVDLADGEELTVDGAVVRGRYSFGVLAERQSIYASAADDALIEVARRGGQVLVRPRHPGNPLRTSFTHTPAFTPDPNWVLPGRFIAHHEPRKVTVGAVTEGLEHVYDSPGYVEFDLDGETYRLTAFNGQAPGSLTVLFTDATSGVTTYAANRALQIAAPDDEGRVTLDFNRAANNPCAYTDLATCPLPPAANRIPVAVEAGQRIPLERRGQP